MRSPFQSVVYIQLKRRWMSVRVLSWAGGDSRWEGAASLQIVRDKNGRFTALAVGQEPGPTAMERAEAHLLAHPRTLVDDPDELAFAVRHFARAAGYKNSVSRPAVIFHLRELLEGGLTPLEMKGLCQVSMKALGSGRVFFVTEERELPAPDVIAIAKNTGKTRTR
jgi:hypothetical protein